MIYVLWGAVALSLLLSTLNALDKDKQMEAINNLANIATSLKGAVDELNTRLAAKPAGHTDEEIKAALDPIATELSAVVASIQAIQ